MKECSLVAVGDISFGGNLSKKLKYYDPFEFVKDEITNSDISVGNLECVLSDSGKPIETYTHLRASSDNVKFLNIFTVLSLANNHILDFGVEGMNDTVNVLHQNGILTLGCGADYQQAIQPLIVERKSIRVGFINFMQNEVTLFTNLTRAHNFRRPGPARYYEYDVLEKIRELKREADIVIALIHWGVEYIPFPSPRQRSLAEKLIDVGVNLIIGHHPHVIQGFQRYHGGLIFYSLGDFVFDPLISKARQGLMVKLGIWKKQIRIRKLVVVELNEYCQLVNSSVGKVLLGYLDNVSKLLKYYDSILYENFWFEHATETYLHSYRSNVALIKNYGIKYIIPFFASLASPYSIKFYAGYARKNLRKMIKWLSIRG